LDGPCLAEIVEIADRLYPFELSEKWDNCGIQVGDGSRIVRSIAVSLNATPETVAFARQHDCELLITHHPLILDPIKNIDTETLVGKTILSAAKLDIGILALHTNLDAARGGLNDRVAAILGLHDVKVPMPAMCARLGRLPAPTSLTETAELVMRRFELPDVRLITGNRDRVVSSVFCASGSGMGYLKDAIRCGADLMITGDVRYHAAIEALEAGISVLDAGHFGLEKVAVPLLAEALANSFEARNLRLKCVPCFIENDPFETLSSHKGAN
jgi:GTP cyclohydrolase I